MLRAVLRPGFSSAAAAAAAASGLSSAQADYRGPETAGIPNASHGNPQSQPKTVNGPHLEALASGTQKPGIVGPKYGLEEDWSVVERGEDGEFAAQLLERPPQRIEVQEAARELEAMFEM